MRVKTQSQSGATYIAGASLTFSATVTHFSCSSCHPALQPIQSASASSMPGLTEFDTSPEHVRIRAR